MTQKGYQTLTMIWRTVAITVEHDENWSKAYQDTYGSQLTHTNIIRDDGLPLPITETGYRSHFTDIKNLENYDGILDYVKQWLDYESQTKSWKAKEADMNQLKLF